MSLSLPSLRPDQLEIAMHPAKEKVITAGRRYGKTVLGGVIAINTLRQHGKVAWMAPTYKNSRPLWRWVLGVCAGNPFISVNRTERILETGRGGLLAVYSGDNADAVRGESFHLVVIDEAAQLGEDTVTDVIMPTLADFDGELILIGTPRGKNWFYNEWQKGMADGKHIASWKLSTNLNPMPSIYRAFELARTRVPERTYQQEWLAEFVDDGGEVFRFVRRQIRAAWLDVGIEGHSYVIGGDLAKSVDFTVFTVIDAATHDVVYVDRFNGVEYLVQMGRLKALSDRFFGAVCVIEENSNEATLEYGRRLGIPLLPFRTTAASKIQAIDDLILAFEQGTIGLPDYAPLIAELEAFTSTKLPSGLVRYEAPQGMHDDCVMSLAIGWHGAQLQSDPAYEVIDATPFTFSY